MPVAKAPWADPQEVVNGWLLDEDLLPDETKITVWIARAQKLVEDTYRIKKPNATPLSEKVAADPDLAETARDIIVAMLERVFSNPEGVRSAMDVTGPLTGSVTYGGDNPGVLDLSDTEARRMGIFNRRRQRAFSVPTAQARGPLR